MIMQEPFGDDRRHGDELHHVLVEKTTNTDDNHGADNRNPISCSLQVCEGGAALTSSSAGMSINNAIAGSPPPTSQQSAHQSTPVMAKWLKKLNKKHLFGVLLLMIVDVIWVASAALTQNLFGQQKYDKPLFTVYFKTVLFTIYLLPFTFWRPWQRLCCCPRSGLLSFMRRKKPTRESNNRLNRSEDKDDDGSINNSIIIKSQLPSKDTTSAYGTFSDTNKDHDLDTKEESSVSFSSTFAVNSSSFSTSVHTNSNDTTDQILGPSRYTPTKFNDDGKYDTNSLTMPRKMQESKNNYLTSSTSNLLCKSTRTNVRFCRTVEVKSVPSQYKAEGEAGGSPSSSAAQSTPIPTLSVKTVFVLATVFGILWFFANYLYAKALETQSVAAVNTLSSLCSVFVLILSAIPFPSLADRDRFSLTKFILIAISVGGVVLIGLSPSSDKVGGISAGVLFSLGGAALYAVYLVLLTKFLPHPESLEIPMFFGFVGLTTGFLIAPVVCAWHYLDIETFQLPPSNMAWTVLLVNGWVGTVLSELLWLWGCLLTSSLVGTLSLALVTPLSIVYNMIFTSNVKFSVEFLVGAGIVVIVFVLVTLIDYFGNGSDPIWTLMKKTWHWLHDDSQSRSQIRYSDENKDLLGYNRPIMVDVGSPPPP